MGNGGGAYMLYYGCNELIGVDGWVVDGRDCMVAGC